ncbi:translation initiation factor IF-2-like [Choloepus didactylus]|uniref:translation initiation factor IF-2-like n=1 Tax=Choloepus didactylus TaxID=27675 RepID=UPI00189E27E0|nr:translation initiation factor IF-2-like [Choloepus didactylus]
MGKRQARPETSLRTLAVFPTPSGSEELEKGGAEASQGCRWDSDRGGPRQADQLRDAEEARWGGDAGSGSVPGYRPGRLVRVVFQPVTTRRTSGRRSTPPGTRSHAPKEPCPPSAPDHPALGRVARGQGDAVSPPPQKGNFEGVAILVPTPQVDGISAAGQAHRNPRESHRRSSGSNSSSSRSPAESVIAFARVRWGAGCRAGRMLRRVAAGLALEECRRAGQREGGAVGPRPLQGPQGEGRGEPGSRRGPGPPPVPSWGEPGMWFTTSEVPLAERVSVVWLVYTLPALGLFDNGSRMLAMGTTFKKTRTLVA